MSESQTGTDDSTELKKITVTVPVEKVLKAVQLSSTHGVDDRVIEVPQRDGGEASIARAFRGSERYSNPSAAPVRIKPSALLEEGFRSPPNRSAVDVEMMDIPNLQEDRTNADQEKFEEAYDAVIGVWKQDARSMIEGEHSFEGKGCDITLVGEN